MTKLKLNSLLGHLQTVIEHNEDVYFFTVNIEEGREILNKLDFDRKEMLKDIESSIENIGRYQYELDQGTISQNGLFMDDCDSLGNSIRDYKQVQLMMTDDIERYNRRNSKTPFETLDCLDYNNLTNKELRNALIKREERTVAMFEKLTKGEVLDLKQDVSVFIKSLLNNPKIDERIKEIIKGSMPSIIIEYKEDIEPIGIKGCSHKIVTLKALGVIEYLSETFKPLNIDSSTNLAKLLEPLLNEKYDTIRKNLTYLDTGKTKDPINKSSVNTVKGELQKLGIKEANLPDFD